MENTSKIIVIVYLCFSGIIVKIIIKNIPDPPGMPGRIAVFDVTHRSCRLQWSAPDLSGGSNIEHYAIYIKANKMFWEKYGEVSGNIHATKINNLKEGTKYMFGLQAINKAGAGEMRRSDQITATGKKLFVFQNIQNGCLFVFRDLHPSNN